eukprot:scaffold58780_cov20-Tisochrysis_lutea.AAC.1
MGSIVGGSCHASGPSGLDGPVPTRVWDGSPTSGTADCFLLFVLFLQVLCFWCSLLLHITDDTSMNCNMTQSVRAMNTPSSKEASGEVWGFDIMLDSSLRAWLIEVNTCPALNSDSPLDKHLKTSMVADLMNLVGPVPYDYDAYEMEGIARRQARLTGLAQQQ